MQSPHRVGNRLCSMSHEDRNVGVIESVLGYAAKQQFACAAVGVGSHYQQVRLNVPAMIEDRLADGGVPRLLENLRFRGDSVIREVSREFGGNLGFRPLAFRG